MSRLGTSLEVVGARLWCDFWKVCLRRRHLRGAFRGVTVLGSGTWVPALCAATALSPSFPALLRVTTDSQEELIPTCSPLRGADYLQGCSANKRLRTARQTPFGKVPARADVQLLI